MSKSEVNIIRSQTWLTDDLEAINSILNEAIEYWVGKDEQIVNIESKTSDSGLSRFWIYTTKS